MEMFIPMSNAHKRKKQPEKVRSDLIECAVRIISEQGPAAVTIQAVAHAAGVTKGGLLHHFSDKNNFSEAVSKYLLDKFDDEINRQIEQDTVEYGKFTRAYIKSISAELLSAPNAQWMALAIYAIAEKESKILWNEWINQKIKIYQDTDSDKTLQILRYSADGIWFDALLETSTTQKEHYELLSRLVELTYPDCCIQGCILKRQDK